jgi:MFS family permease
MLLLLSTLFKDKTPNKDVQRHEAEFTPLRQCAALALFAFNRNLYIELVLLAVSGFGIVFYFSTSNTVLQTIVPDEMRGRVMGIWTLVFGGMMPLGSLQAGLMADVIGTPATIAIGALICALAAVVTLEVVRKREARRAAVAI